MLDTDVFSYLMKAGDSPMKDVYKPHVKGKLVAVSFITVGELLFGAYKKNWSEAKVRDLRERLRSVVIVPYDIEVCDTYATLKSRLQADGISIADNDLWIAACAIRHAIPLISNNRSHFERVPGLILISEAPIVKEIQSQTELDLNRQPSGAGAPPGSAAS